MFRCDAAALLLPGLDCVAPASPHPLRLPSTGFVDGSRLPPLVSGLLGDARPHHIITTARHLAHPPRQHAMHTHTQTSLPTRPPLQTIVAQSAASNSFNMLPHPYAWPSHACHSCHISRLPRVLSYAPIPRLPHARTYYGPHFLTMLHPVADRHSSFSPNLALVRTSVYDWLSQPSDTSGAVGALLAAVRCRRPSETV